MKYFQGEKGFEALSRSNQSILYRLFERLTTPFEVVRSCDMGSSYPLDVQVIWLEEFFKDPLAIESLGDLSPYEKRFSI